MVTLYQVSPIILNDIRRSPRGTYADPAPLATNQKVGGSNPSGRALSATVSKKLMDAILLFRLAFSCVYRHRFTPFSAVNGPKSDPVSACLGGSIRGTVFNHAHNGVLCASCCIAKGTARYSAVNGPKVGLKLSRGMHFGEEEVRS